MLPLAKVFTVTKNEYDLIEDFLLYHGYLFGYENLVVIDNGSTDTRVLEVYETYKLRGVTVVTRIGYKGGQQGDHFTDVMKEYRQAAEFLIGLDTDLFFCVDQSSDRDLVHKYLRSLPQSYDIFRMKKFLMSVVDPTSPNYQNRKLLRPTDSTTFVVRDGYAGVSIPHVFFRAANFLATSNGNHSGVTTTGKAWFCSRVSYVHYHETGRQRLYERCRAILIAYGYIEDGMTPEQELRALRTLANGDGIHRQRQYICYLENPALFFQEDPMPVDTFHFEGVKSIVFKQCECASSEEDGTGAMRPESFEPTVSM
jgi:hypothetical protein